MLFDAHTRSFAALGGVPRGGIYDNMKTAVDKVNTYKNVHFVPAPTMQSRYSGKVYISSLSVGLRDEEQC